MQHYLRNALKSIRPANVFKYGLLTNVAFGVILRGTGDLIQQSIECRKQPVEDESKTAPCTTNWRRTSMFFQ